MTQVLTTSCVLSAVLLLSLGCRDAEQRQSDELREALLRTLDEVEEVCEKELSIRKSTNETYKELEELEGVSLLISSTAKNNRRTNEKLREERPEALKEVRKRVKEYTSLELPRLAVLVRGLPGEAEYFLTSAQKEAQQAREWVQQAKKRTSQKTARKRSPSAGNRKSGSTMWSGRFRPASRTKQATAKQPPPPPDLEELRKAYSARIEKLDKMHEDLIEILTAVQAAQSDKLQKRWAGDRITMARFARRKDISPLRSRLEKAKNLHDLEGVQIGIGFQELHVKNTINEAKKKLREAQVQEK